MKIKFLLIALLCVVLLCGCGENNISSSDSENRGIEIIEEHNDNYIPKLLSTEADPKYKDVYYFNCQFIKDTNGEKYNNYDLYYSGDDTNELPMLFEKSWFEMSLYIYTEYDFKNEIIPPKYENDSEGLQKYKEECQNKILTKGGTINIYYKGNKVAEFSYDLPKENESFSRKNVKFDKFENEEVRHAFETYKYYEESKDNK